LQPSVESQALLKLIRFTPPPAQGFQPDRKTRARLTISFVGRAEEYQGLLDVFRLARNGKTQVALISGESGIGKTRLAEEFLQWATSEGVDVLRGRAFRSSGHLPYQPVIDALRERLECENAPEDLLADPWLVELSRILPELRERYPDLPLNSDDDPAALARLFEAIARLVEALSARRPLVWLMDDLQWADTATLDLLHYLSRHWQKSCPPLLLLILLRTEALGHGSLFRDWLPGLERELPVTRFRLSLLNVEEMRQLVFLLAGENASGGSDLSTWLINETAGQPFVLSETLAALDENSILAWREEPSARSLDPRATLENMRAKGPQPPSLAMRDVVLSRLEGLSQPAKLILAASAVIGRRCSYHRLREVSGTGVEESLDALDELLSTHMLLEDRSENLSYIVAHDHISVVVYAQLSQARRQVYHRRMLTVLLESGAPAADLAHHALSAGDWKSGFAFSVEAGEDAMHLYAVASAAQHFEVARTLIQEYQLMVDTPTCQQLYIRLGKAYELGLQPKKALAVYEEMLAQAAARGSQEMQIAALDVLRPPLSPVDTQD
ncbi:MAG: AAA family ATPase, partial [Anaerolineaceae bacterium]|nr:AAA family ATPase [Anaerolineaceae bacterium]